MDRPIGSTRDSLLAAVASPDPWTRAVALEKFARLHPDAALPHLIRAVSGPDGGSFGGGHDETVMAYALDALEAMGPLARHAASALEGSLATDYRAAGGPEDWEELRHKLAALCSVTGPEHAAMFLRDLFDALGKSRREWAGTLLMFSSAYADQFATLLEGDPDAGVREEVALHRGTAPG